MTKKKQFKIMYLILNLLWGSPLTLIGGIVALILLVAGKRPFKYGGCWFFRVGKKEWGGLNLGLVSLIGPRATGDTMRHEFGHSIQNTRFGPLMLFIILIPSAFRNYWRKLRRALGLRNGDYDAVWFERDAIELGEKYIKMYD